MWPIARDLVAGSRTAAGVTSTVNETGSLSDTWPKLMAEAGRGSACGACPAWRCATAARSMLVPSTAAAARAVSPRRPRAACGAGGPRPGAHPAPAVICGIPGQGELGGGPGSGLLGARQAAAGQGIEQLAIDGAERENLGSARYPVAHDGDQRAGERRVRLPRPGEVDGTGRRRDEHVRTLGGGLAEQRPGTPVTGTTPPLKQQSRMRIRCAAGLRSMASRTRPTARASAGSPSAAPVTLR